MRRCNTDTEEDSAKDPASEETLTLGLTMVEEEEGYPGAGIPAQLWLQPTRLFNRPMLPK